MKRLRNILKDDSGQGMLEYVILLAAVVAIGLIFKDKITSIFNSGINSVSSQSSSLFGGGSN